MAKLELFYDKNCPFCIKVINYMKSANIELPMLDIYSDKTYRDRLIAEGGKKQVPCLFIDGKALYESDDIIEYLGGTPDKDSVVQACPVHYNLD